MEKQKKKRGENWSDEDKEILRQLIAQSAHIIEDKSTKTKINILKIIEWKNIMIKINEITGKIRSVAEIKLAWKRMKLAAKSSLSFHRREQLKTGGGEKPPSPSPEDLQVMAIAPHDFIIENDYGSDAVIQMTSPQTTFTSPQAATSFEITAPLITTQSNIITEEAENTEINVVSTNNQKNEITAINNSATVTHVGRKKLKTSQNRNEEMRQTIVKSNTEFKEKQLEMLQVEHTFNVKIFQLKIRKLELEIALLERKKTVNE